jgi:alpha-N-arabinofuranosidase
MTSRPTSLAWLRGFMLGCLLLVAPPAWAQTSQQIYADGLVNGWQNWSWAAVDLANASPVHAGSQSARVNTDAWEAIYLQHAAFDSGGYTDLVFWIHGGSTGGQLLHVQALLDGTPQAVVALPPLPANTWQQITITLASLGVANRPNLDGFWIQDRSGTTQPAFYVDDVSLTAVAPPALVNVVVETGRHLRTIDARHFGVSAAVWDAAFDTPTTIGLLTEMGTQTLRFPGGSLSNDYHWQSNTTGSNTWQWATSFDEFAHVAVAVGAQVFISVNYGSGTPTEAAEWVRHANVTQGYGVKYWEIGNENYGGWETDLNNRPHDPHTYANRFKEYYHRMKAVDPTIKIGAVAVTGEDSYANYTDHPATNPRTGQAHNGWTPVMLATLKSLGVTPDFLIHHRYAQAPGAESDAGLLQSSSTWAVDAADLRQQLTDYLGAAGAAVELVCTENNSVFTNPGKQTTSLVNALFLADSLGEAMKTEFNGVIWWDLRNGADTTHNNAPSLYGWRLYGDYGIVNDATPAGPADRYPTFYVTKLLQHFARGGDRLVAASSDFGLLSVYAARRASGPVTLLAINKSPTSALEARITLQVYGLNGTIDIHSYGIPQDEAARTGAGSADIAATSMTGEGSAFTYTFPPYSVTVLSMRGGFMRPSFGTTPGGFLLPSITTSPGGSRLPPLTTVPRLGGVPATPDSD